MSVPPFVTSRSQASASEVGQCPFTQESMQLTGGCNLKAWFQSTCVHGIPVSNDPAQAQQLLSRAFMEHASWDMLACAPWLTL